MVSIENVTLSNDAAAVGRSIGSFFNDYGLNPEDWQVIINGCAIKNFKHYFYAGDVVSIRRYSHPNAVPLFSDISASDVPIYVEDPYVMEVA